MNEDGIVATFQMDTLICAVEGMMLEHYQMAKHGWTSDQQREYLQEYKDILIKRANVNTERKG